MIMLSKINIISNNLSDLVVRWINNHPRYIIVILLKIIKVFLNNITANYYLGISTFYENHRKKSNQLSA